jgi:hypothetical protein
VNRTQNKDVFALNFIEALEKTKQGHSPRSWDQAMLKNHKL